MNSKTEAFAHLGMAVVIMFVLSVIIYYIGCEMAPRFIINPAKEAGLSVPKFSVWQEYYFYLVMYMGIIAGFILLFWTALTHWALHTSDSTGVGKRWLWVLLGIILAVLCVVFPTLYKEINDYRPLILNMSVPLLFVVCYCLLGYWLGSIFVTSDRYKYTPLLSGFFLS